MKTNGYEGEFDVEVMDEGDSYVVSVEAKFREGIDPLNILPTTPVMNKETYSLEDAKQEADRMRNELIETGDVIE